MGQSRSEGPSVPKLVARIGLHDHLCLIYEKQKEQLLTLTSFVEAGLNRGEKCVCIGDENSATAVAHALSARGIDVQPALKTGTLTLADVKATYLKQGYFDPDWMISFLVESANAAKGGGYSAFRLAGDMTWLQEAGPGTERRLEYESNLSRFLRQYDASALCLYPRSRFPPEVILGAIRTHNLVFYGGVLCKNPYYVPAEELLKSNQPELEIQRLLNYMRHSARAEEEIHGLPAELLLAQDQEWRRVAWQLHEVVSQNLAALSFNLGVVNEAARTLKPKTKKALADSFSLLEACVRQLRVMSYDLHPPLLEVLGLAAALRSYTKGFAERTGIQIDLAAPSKLGDTPDDVALTLYRVTQESLTYIHRRSRSRSAQIRLVRERNMIRLTVVSYDPVKRPEALKAKARSRTTQQRFARGVGIPAMRERVRELGGRLEVWSGKKGTTVKVELPIEGSR